MFRTRLPIALGFALALAAPAFAEQTRTFTATFPTTVPVRLANLAGTTVLESSAGSAIEVVVTVHAAGRDDAETQKLLGLSFIESRDREGRVEQALSYPVEQYSAFSYPRGSLRGREPGFFESVLIGFFSSLSSTSATYRGRQVRIEGGSGAPMLYADLVVRLPADADLALRTMVGAMTGGELAARRLSLDTGGGSVTLTRFAGELEVDTGSGSIHLGGLNGNGTLDTGSGGVTVDAVDADRLDVDTGSGGIAVRNGRVATLRADTGSGSIDVQKVEIERFVGDTGSGAVTLESSLAHAREVTIDTGSGSVRILAAPDAAFDLRAEQGSGELEVGYADASLIRDGGSVVGARRGSGGAVIRIDTGSGSCEIAPRS